ncbi:single-stranded DNA-binding protein [Streptococcus cuniculipharyngis]|uniref:Single-stranded DNA-binding protein n=1 Tax=Streptococcus cuniculipharyngis TaxID=1562651 RepID=A0A5C5SA47_9STRE|nr:single-stranded DNA-binding protein [Streptococcus cuniculipharyngis]TWS96444.1 single-stranded DNA-binding protein [Streptococcus cuniculipharyngis]
MLNKTILIGRLTATPELVKTPTDKSLARVSLAVNRRFKNQEGEHLTDFINLVFWGRSAENLVSYASKGSLLSVDGELRTRKYEKDGQNHYITEVLVTSFRLLESRAQRAMRENNQTDDLVDLVLEEEALPF